MAVKAWLKLALDVSWAWISLSVIRAVYQPPGAHWTIINRVMQVWPFILVSFEFDDIATSHFLLLELSFWSKNYFCTS